MKLKAPDALRELARRRLDKIHQLTPEQIAAEVEEARKEGCQVVRVGDVSVWIKKYTGEATDSPDDQDRSR